MKTRHTLYIIVFFLFCCIRGEAQESLPYTLSSFGSWYKTGTFTPDHVWKYGSIPSSSPYSNLPTNESYCYISDNVVNNNGTTISSGKFYSISQNFDFSTVDKPVISFFLYYYFDENATPAIDNPSLRITYGNNSITNITLKEWVNNVSDGWEYVSICCDGEMALKSNAQINIEVESYSSVGCYIAIKDFKITGFKVTNITAHNTSCFGYDDGSIDVTVEGAGPNYAFSQNGSGTGASWTQVSSNTFTYTNLINTTYPIAIKDVSSGCSLKSDVIVKSDHDVIGFDVNPSDVTCYTSDNGSIEIKPKGDYGDYLYSKDDGATFQDEYVFTNLASATYKIKVKTKDAAACESQAVIVNIGSSKLLRINEVIPTNIETCFGEEKGSIKVNAESKVGSIAYHFEYNGAPYPGNSQGEIYDLAAGLYNISVEDDNGCVVYYDNNPVEIKQPPQLVFNGYTAVDVTGCYGAHTGSISINTPDGGSGGYKYSIDGINFESQNTFTAPTSNLLLD